MKQKHSMNYNYINLLTFQDVESIMSKLFFIKFRNQEMVDEILKKMTIVMMNNQIEVCYKHKSVLFRCFLTDYDVDMFGPQEMKSKITSEFRKFMCEKIKSLNSTLGEMYRKGLMQKICKEIYLEDLQRERDLQARLSQLSDL